ncbi:MAG: hypothetical protein Kow0032_00970 [Methyloligellaceae bacterium]
MLPLFSERSPVREIKRAPLDLKRVGTDGTFSGYASVFGAQDMGRDVVMPGAFAESLRKRGPGGIKLLFQHDPAEPIGVWEEIREDARGLWVRGRLLLQVARAREVLSLLRAGAIDGLSIGFRAVSGRRDPRSGVRYLHKVDLWEISIVTFPMLPHARIDAVKHGPGSGEGAAFPAVRLACKFAAAAQSLRASLRPHRRSGYRPAAVAPGAGGGASPEGRLAHRFRRAARALTSTPTQPSE